MLDACEDVIRRLTSTAATSLGPARTLFNEVRMHFAIGDQLRVWIVIDRNIKLALEFLERMPEGAGLDGPGRAARTHARARRASASRCRAATTARRTSTSRSPSTVRSCPMEAFEGALEREEVNAAA